MNMRRRSRSVLSSHCEGGREKEGNGQEMKNWLKIGKTRRRGGRGGEERGEGKEGGGKEGRREGGKDRKEEISVITCSSLRTTNSVS